MMDIKDHTAEAYWKMSSFLIETLFWEKPFRDTEIR